LFFADAATTFFNSNVTPSINERHHVLVSVSGGVGGMYLDGTLITTVTGATTASFAACLLGRQTIVGRYFDGELYRYEFFSRAFTLAEIAADYANSSKAKLEWL
jgi:hypothetical protein